MLVHIFPGIPSKTMSAYRGTHFIPLRNSSAWCVGDKTSNCLPADRRDRLRRLRSLWEISTEILRSEHGLSVLLAGFSFAGVKYPLNISKNIFNLKNYEPSLWRWRRWNLRTVTSETALRPPVINSRELLIRRSSVFGAISSRDLLLDRWLDAGGRTCSWIGTGGGAIIFEQVGKVALMTSRTPEVDGITLKIVIFIVF